MVENLEKKHLDAEAYNLQKIRNLQDLLENTRLESCNAEQAVMCMKSQVSDLENKVKADQTVV